MVSEVGRLGILYQTETDMSIAELALHFTLSPLIPGTFSETLR